MQGYFWPLSVQIRLFSFFLSQSPVSGRLQAGECTLELAFWIPLHFCLVSVLFVFFCLAVSLSPDCWLPADVALQPKKVKPSSKTGRFGWRERGQKGSIPTVGVALVLALSHSAPLSRISSLTWDAEMPWDAQGWREEENGSQDSRPSRAGFQVCPCLLCGLWSFLVSLIAMEPRMRSPGLTPAAVD